MWHLLLERPRDGLIGTWVAMSPVVGMVTASHLDHAGPVVIEGGNIIPVSTTSTELGERVVGGRVALVILVEPDEGALLGNMLARGRGMAGRSDAELRTEARAKWLFGQWLISEADRHGLPVIEPRPWKTLADRIVRATTRR